MRYLILILILCCGCSVKTTIITPDGLTYTVNCESDAMISLKQDKVEMIVDNRGRPSFLEAFFSTMVVTMPQQFNFGSSDTNRPIP